MVAEVLAQTGPILKEAAALGEEAARLQAEALGQAERESQIRTGMLTRTTGTKPVRRRSRVRRREKPGPGKTVGEPGIEKEQLAPSGNDAPPPGDWEKPGGEQEPPERDDD